MKKGKLVLPVVGLVLTLSLLLGFAGGHAWAAEPIRVGAVLSITGWAGSLGTSEKEAMTIVADDINRRGGVLGRQIEMYFEDDQTNPTNAAIAATKLIRDKKVAVLLGSTVTVVCMPILPIAEREQILNISIGAGHEITDPLKKWVFRIPLTDYRLAPMMLKSLSETLKARKIALLYSSDGSGIMGAKGIVDYAAKYGVSIAINEKFDPKDTTVIPQLSKIKAANVDAIVLYTTGSPAAVVAKNYQQLGMRTPVVASQGVSTTEFLKLAGKIVEGSQWLIFGMKPLYAEQVSPDDPYRKMIYDPFKKSLKEKFNKTDINSFHANAHDAMYILEQALKIAGTDNRAALRDAMEKVKYKGLLNEAWAYSATDHDGNTGDGVEPLIVKDGKFWPYKK